MTYKQESLKHKTPDGDAKWNSNTKILKIYLVTMHILTFAQIREFLVHFINQLFFHFTTFYFLQFTNNCHFFIFTIFLSFLQFVSIAILSIVSIISHAMGWKCLNFVFKSEVTNFLCTKIKIFGLLRKGFSQQNVAWLCCICVQHSFNPSFDHKKDIRGLLSSSFSCIQFSTTSRENHLEFLEKLESL